MMITEVEIDEPKQQPKKSNWLWLVILILLIVSGAAASYYFLVMKNQDEGTNIGDIKKVTLSSFSVNLADAGNRRYLRTTITLEYTSEDTEKELEITMHRIKDVVLNVLRDKKVIDVDTPAETNELKKELLEAINSRLTKGNINGLYFEEFIIQ